MNKDLMATYGLILLLMVVISCGSSNGLKDRIDNKYNLELGIIAEDKVDNFLNQVALRYGYEIARRENYSNTTGFYVETFWKQRLPFLDEQKKNIEQVNTKLIIKGKLIRNRTSTLSLSEVFYEIDLEVLQKGREKFKNDFVAFSFTNQGYDYVKDLSYDLKDFVQARLIQ